MKIKLLVDTGASLCVIKYEWLRNYPDLVNKIISDRITIKGISGNLVSLGYIYLDLYFDGQAFNQKYYIFENISCSADGILGQEFFLKYNAVLNYKDCTLTLKDKGCLITTEIIGNNRYVRTIPPSCEIIKHIPTNDCSDCVILAREIPSHSGIFIAGMIARPKNGQIGVRILNTTDKEETIDFFISRSS